MKLNLKSLKKMKFFRPFIRRLIGGPIVMALRVRVTRKFKHYEGEYFTFLFQRRI